MQESATFPITDFGYFKQQLLSWANQFSSCSFLDNHQYSSPFHQQECLVAAGVHCALKANAGNALQQLQQFITANNGEWIFGHLGFGLMDEIHELHSRFTTQSGFKDLNFFVPEVVVKCKGSEAIVFCQPQLDAQDIFFQITSTDIELRQDDLREVAYDAVMNRDEYLQVIAELQKRIRLGDCYEINFCQEFVAKNVDVDPIQLYKRLERLSPNPFSCFYKNDHSFLVCASPERYMMKKNDRLISQPIKGTAVRNLQDDASDALNKAMLAKSEKDQRENVMVVDLVRNDMSKVCKPGTVQVDELFGIYTYPNVHQMISTVSGEFDSCHNFTDIIRATFPMGSMTGAPKHKVLQMIDAYECSARGIFSGSVGYIAPNGDFDFNVVIRSIVYNLQQQLLSFHVGSGITYYSKPETEYEECMWKAIAIHKALQETIKA